MSWQTYVDANLVGSGKVSRAAILGQGGGVWASSPGYSLSLDEQKTIRDSFANKGLAEKHGIQLLDKKYITFLANERSIYSRKGGDGAILVKTKQAVLVAEYVAPTQAPEATLVVEGLADYLINAGY